jgi:mono/diheme cytochrome c family protein
MKGLGVLLAILLLASGCYYDKAEELYPPGDCDTATVGWSATIKPILQNRCYACHNASSANVSGAGIALEPYSNLQSYLIGNSERFLGAIQHGSGYSPMPKGGGKLSDCELLQINQWIAGGYPEN